MNNGLEIVPDTEDLHATYAAAFAGADPVHLIDYMQTVNKSALRMVCGVELDSYSGPVNLRTLNGICPACKAEQERRELAIIEGMAADIRAGLPGMTEAEALQVAVLAVECW